MKLHLKDYSLISNEVLKEKLEYYEERNKREPSNSYIEGKMDLLRNLIGNHLIPSEKLAEKCFDMTKDIIQDNVGIRQVFYSPTDEQECYFFEDAIEKSKQILLSSEIELP